MKEQVSVDDIRAANLIDCDFASEIKRLADKLAQERTKYIEDYMKFWLAVNVENLESLTPEIFAKEYSLLIKNFPDAEAYQMVKFDEINICKEEYERLKRLKENVKMEIEHSKKEITRINIFIANGYASPYQLQRIEHFEDKIKLLESLYNEKP